MSAGAEKEARRALARLRRAVEKVERELDAVAGSIRHAEGSDFPADAYEEARERLQRVTEFVDEESARLQMKILETGGIEPGRVRRSGGL
ncbi:MAG: hypothetical protein R3E98_12640 [Gemmatimonadota bacterium]|nr:hypothetical protein [Gemmatimonadota bacterium]